METINGWPVVRVKETGSTNDDARNLAAEGAPHGTVVVAESQIAGRGRRGSTWVSPPGRNLICSVLLRPEFKMERWPRLTHAASVAISLALEEMGTGLEPSIKWPNDIFLNGKKVCGILLETSSQQQEGFVVIGFGLNINLGAEEFPEELQNTATSLQIETGRVWGETERELLFKIIVEKLQEFTPAVEHNFTEILIEVTTRSHLTGQKVSLLINDLQQVGIVRGISHSGGLLFENANGEVQNLLSADHIRIL
jgi:BirA family biotin operon repressor/biotin-[acetyl-CoA-carboxylase] ligase